MFKRRREGWLAFGMFPGRIDVVHAVRGAGARPQLLRLDSYARGDDDAKALTALRKQGGLQSFGCTTLLDPAAYSVTQMEAPAVPEAGAYDVDKTFWMGNILASGSTYTLTVQDYFNPECTATITVQGPEPCSDSCTLHLQPVVGPCNDNGKDDSLTLRTQ